MINFEKIDITKKTLIFGCSLTLGSYIPYNGYEQLDNNIGWYNFISSIRSKFVDVYAIGGGGYTDWAQIMREIKISNCLDQYDTVIIAETTTPRFSLWIPDFKKDSLDRSENDICDVHATCYQTCVPRNTSMTSHPVPFQLILKNYGTLSNFDIDRYTLDVCSSPSLNFYEEAAMLYMRTLLIDMNVKVYVFSFFGPQMPAYGDTITRLDDNIFYKILDSDAVHNLTNHVRFSEHALAHQTLTGNRAVGLHLSGLIEQSQRCAT